MAPALTLIPCNHREGACGDVPTDISLLGCPYAGSVRLPLWRLGGAPPAALVVGKMLAETHTTTASEFSTTAQDTHPSKAGENASTAGALLRSGARDASDNVLNDSQYSRTRSMDSESTIVDSICCRYDAL